MKTAIKIGMMGLSIVLLAGCKEKSHQSDLEAPSDAARAFTRRSASRMSGRRSSRFAGMPMPIVSMYSGNGFRVSMISRTSQG